MVNIKNAVDEQMELTSNIIFKYPWHDPRAYAMWLAQTYYMVSHSTRLVALAGAHCPLEKNTLHARFVDHAKEERGHEKICVADINTLGFKLSDFPQTYQSAAMYQVQYYWIQHRNPVAFFGYTLALECLAERFGPHVYKVITESIGTKATKFLKLHSEDDVEHTQSAYSLIATLSANELELVKENLALSSDLYRGMLTESMNQYQHISLKKAGSF